MMRRLRLVLCCSAVTCLAPAGTTQLHAQERAVPMEVVRALLLPADGGGLPTLRVGEAPEIAGVEVGDGRVIGAVVRQNGPTVAIAHSGAPRVLLAAARERLERAGWSASAMQPTSGGFLATGAEEIAWFCRDGNSIQLMARAAPADATYLIYRLQSPAPARTCTGDAHQGGPPWLKLLPALRPPDGATLTGRETRSGPREVTTGALVGTQLPLQELLDHYERQVIEQGWRRTERQAGESVAMILFHGDTPELQDHTAVLMTALLSGSGVSAEFRVIAPSNLY
jgi:hypothetical protein